MIIRGAAIVLLTLVAAGAGLAQSEAPEVSPLPVPRVEPAVPEAEAVPIAEDAARAELVLLEPPPEPLVRETDQEFNQCLDDLRRLNVTFEQSEPVVDEDAACGITRPVTVTAVAGTVALRPAAVLRCSAARSLAEWVETFLLPAARMLPDRGELVGLEQGTGYMCRRRNNAEDGKLSEHGLGNAVDIMGFEFAEGAPIKVEPRERQGTRAESFQDAARATACLSFSTVLGPGSDAAHADHLHLDVIERRGGFRLCQ